MSHLTGPRGWLDYAHPSMERSKTSLACSPLVPRDIA